MAQWFEQTNELSRGQLSPELELLTRGASGGKLVRGTLVCLGYDLAGGPANPAILSPAAAYEILHAGLLIHDDVMDRSLLRRGIPTSYKALGQDHYAISQSICLGDAAFFLAAKTLVQSKFAPKLAQAASVHFARIIQEVVVGQMLDAKHSATHTARQESDAVLIQLLKGARYSVAGPLLVGAALAGAGARLLAPLERFGEAVGMAFQIEDDILGTFGDESATGKPSTTDIEGNKNTLLIVHALAHGAPAARQILAASYGRGKLTPAQYSAVRQAFIDSGALEYSRSKAKSYINAAIEIIPQLTANSDQRALLTQFAHYNLRRRK